MEPPQAYCHFPRQSSPIWKFIHLMSQPIKRNTANVPFSPFPDEHSQSIMAALSQKSTFSDFHPKVQLPTKPY